ncbi:hypothetical protein ACF1BS_04275 [Streptomyces sp. NPDC014748]|uniref:hypothetical protein n=1 Tax=Streptomyces sp. NPDC014748 TaxID=3364905 RepID=UPI0036F6FE83
MSVPERTGRARPGHGCLRDTETGGIGSEVMCCVCGKGQWRWGWERTFWARETHREIVRGVLVAAWLAGQIVRAAGPRPQMSADEAAWVREHVWPPSWLRQYGEVPSTFLACACQKPLSLPCQRGDHYACGHDGHPVRETVIQTHALRAARFAEPYQHPAAAGSNGRRGAYGTNDAAWVWPAGSPCREICTCVCHLPPPATPAHRPQQLDLFTTETTGP